MSTIAFFNNKGGVGKTSLVYHLSWMFSLDYRVLAVDLDPQCNLSGMFLDERELEEAWDGGEHNNQTIYQAISPLKAGRGDIEQPHVHEAEGGDGELGLLIGETNLSLCEDDLSYSWNMCGGGDERAFRVTSMFARLIKKARSKFKADIVLVDVGPNLGAINRAALLSCDYVILPLGPDMFSLQGLKNVGMSLKKWRNEWKEYMKKAPGDAELRDDLPDGRMTPAGYLVMRHSVRLNRPTKAYAHWIEQFPAVYREKVLLAPRAAGSPGEDCIASLKDYRSLMPMAQESRKPMFNLKPGDGVFGENQKYVRRCYDDFKKVAKVIASRCQLPEPRAI